VGRTGVVLTVLNSKDAIIDKVIQAWGYVWHVMCMQGVVDVMGHVNTLRGQRMQLVQTPEQYVFVYKVLLDFVEVCSCVISSSLHVGHRLGSSSSKTLLTRC
jgi:protein tyrosine phosphatase